MAYELFVVVDVFVLLPEAEELAAVALELFVALVVAFVELAFVVLFAAVVVFVLTVVFVADAVALVLVVLVWAFADKSRLSSVMGEGILHEGEN